MNTLELARELIRKASVTPADAGCQQLIAEQLGASGFAVEHLKFGEVDNLWAKRGRGRPALVFAGHTDVVPTGPLDQWRSIRSRGPSRRSARRARRGRHEGLARGDGQLVPAVRDAHPDAPGALGLLITSDEEGAADDGTLKVMETLSGRGESSTTASSASRRAASGSATPCVSAGAAVCPASMTISGVQGHVAYPLRGDNPMHALARFVAAMTREPIDAGNEHFPPTTFQMVNLHCDAGAPNVVPGELKCRFNLRYSNVGRPRRYRRASRRCSASS